MPLRIDLSQIDFEQIGDVWCLVSRSTYTICWMYMMTGTFRTPLPHPLRPSLPAGPSVYAACLLIHVLPVPDARTSTGSRSKLSGIRGKSRDRSIKIETRLAGLPAGGPRKPKASKDLFVRYLEVEVRHR